MGRMLRVETHPEKDQIIKSLIKGQSYRSIAKKFSISNAAILRYMNSKLAAKIARSKRAAEEFTSSRAMDEIRTVMERMTMLYDACHEYLKDPNDPRRYELGPRAWEIEVTYLDGDKKTPRKDNLQLLLDRVEKKGKERKTWLEIKYKHADPRKLIIDTASTLTRQLELIARICGELKDSPAIMNQVVVYLSKQESEQEWQRQRK
jgi:hypothetical protein